MSPIEWCYFVWQHTCIFILSLRAVRAKRLNLWRPTTKSGGMMFQAFSVNAQLAFELGPESVLRMLI